MNLTQSVSITAAFLGGVFSFLSPCVLPLIPSYVSFISGIASGSLNQEIENKKLIQTQILINSLLFILGFSIIFVFLGAIASSLGQFLHKYMDILKKIAGILVIILGLHMTGVFQIKTLFSEKRIHFKSRPPGYIGSVLIGMAFAAGWTPCIGPILATILALASTEDTVLSGMGLLFIYSLGFGLPFFITALLIDNFFKHFKKIQRYMNLIGIISGILIIIVGFLIFTDNLIKLGVSL